MNRRVLCLAIVATACSETELSGTAAGIEVPERIELGTGYAGAELDDTLYITSTGTGLLRLDRADSDTPQLEVDLPDGLTGVQPGLQVGLPLRWRPRLAGELDAVVTLYSDAPTAVVRVTGRALEMPACDDGNPCTAEQFDPLAGRCEYTPLDADACDDGNLCTSGDVCVAGSCVGGAVDCSDGNACTLDRCDPAAGCVNPPDEDRCDDGDPCTLDVCGEGGTCAHPMAADWTPCGALTCALAKFCQSGVCLDVDVSATTDGIACDDGDACSDPDTCAGGVCNGGPLVRTEPVVLGQFETFGGEGSYVSTDGYRYLFNDVGALRLVVDSGDLELTSSLPFAASGPPVNWAPGLFVVQTPTGLAMLDATDPPNPFVRWELAADDVWLALEGAVSQLIGLHFGDVDRVTGGLVASMAGSTPGSGTLLAVKVVFIPLDDTGPGPAVSLTDYAPHRMVAGDDQYAVISSGYETEWLQLAADGAVLARAISVSTSLDPIIGIAVSNERVALASESLLTILQPGSPIPAGTCPPDTPDCIQVTQAVCGTPVAAEPGWYYPCMDSQGCPLGTACESVYVPPADCSGQGWNQPLCVGSSADTSTFEYVDSVGLENIRDVTSAGDYFLVGTADGVFVVGALDTSSSRFATRVAASHVEYEGGHMLTAGPMAIPWQQTAGGAWVDGPGGPGTGGPAEPPPGSLPDFRPVSGVWHGTIEAIAPGATDDTVLLGSELLWAEVSTSNLAPQFWNFRPENIEGLIMLRGPQRHALVHHDVPASGDNSLCPGPSLTTIDAGQVIGVQSMCDLDGGTLALAGEHLWATTTEGGDPIYRSYEVGPDGAAIALASSEITPAFGPDFEVGQSRARESSDQQVVAIVSTGLATPSELLVTVYSAGGHTEHESVFDGYALGFEPTRKSFAVDGNLLFFRNGPSSVALVSTASDVERVHGIVSGPALSVDIEWMDDGEAWVSHGLPLNTGVLTQLSYTSPAEPIATHGQVELPGQVRTLFHEGTNLIVATDISISLVAPACVP